MLNKSRSVLRSTLSQILVEWGASWNISAAKLTYETDPYLHYSRHKPIVPLECSRPVLSKGVKLAYTASLEGEVQLDSNVVIGSQSTLRGDMSPIRIGEGSIIGEQVTMHTKELHQLIPGSIDIGVNVYIGDKVTLKSCIIDDGAYIGEGCFIAEGAVVQRGAIVLPSTTVQPGAILTSGKVWGGNPCREIAEATDKYTNRVAERVKNARAYIEAVEKDKVFIEIDQDEEDKQEAG